MSLFVVLSKSKCICLAEDIHANKAKRRKLDSDNTTLKLYFSETNMTYNIIFL